MTSLRNFWYSTKRFTMICCSMAFNSISKVYVLNIFSWLKQLSFTSLSFVRWSKKLWMFCKTVFRISMQFWISKGFSFTLDRFSVLKLNHLKFLSWNTSVKIPPIQIFEAKFLTTPSLSRFSFKHLNSKTFATIG